MNAPIALPLAEKENTMNAQTKVATYEERPQSVAAATPMQMLQHALENGASVEMMERLLALQERWESTQARKAFDAAMAAAKAEMPVIEKNRHVSFKSRNGGTDTDYRHEDLAGVVRAVNPVLAKHGLSFRFRTETAEQITVTCIISHRDGHSEENTLIAARDTWGSKNSIQAIGSTVTYLQRYTLKAALGLAASHDDDGRGSEPPEVISEAQADQLRDLIAAVEASADDMKRFFAVMKIGGLADMPASRFEEAVDRLQTFGRKKGKEV